MKLLEAMAMKKAVLVSNVAGITQVVKDRVNGFVFKNNDTSDFINKLKTVIESPDDRLRVGEIAYQNVQADYTWQRARTIIQNRYNFLSLNQQYRSPD